MNPLSLYQITEGRCEYTEALAAPLSDFSLAAFAQLPRLKPSYEGQLFRVRYEVRGLGPEPLRVWVDGQGRASLYTEQDGYAHLGLSRNPFVLERYTARCEAWTGVAQAHWLERGHEAPQPGTRTLVQLLGVKGAGKSSHLARWRGVQRGPGTPSVSALTKTSATWPAPQGWRSARWHLVPSPQRKCAHGRSATSQQRSFQANVHPYT